MFPGCGNFARRVFSLRYNRGMSDRHYRHVRRALLKALYQQYREDPLEMVEPERLLPAVSGDRRDLMFNMHYLADRGLVEMMLGYRPPLFSGARITANGIDLVENRIVFDAKYPPLPDQCEAERADLPLLLAQLADEAEFCAVDGEVRRALLRDVAYLQDEAARPAARWRAGVMMAVLEGISGMLPETGDGAALPSLEAAGRRIRGILEV